MGAEIKPQIGGTVYVIPYGQRSATNPPHAETVTKIGRAYFYTDSGRAFALAPVGGRWLDKETDFGYGHNWEAFPDETALASHYRRHTLLGEVRGMDWDSLSLSRLEGVMAIIRDESVLTDEGGQYGAYHF